MYRTEMRFYLFSQKATYKDSKDARVRKYQMLEVTTWFLAWAIISPQCVKHVTLDNNPDITRLAQFHTTES